MQTASKNITLLPHEVFTKLSEEKGVKKKAEILKEHGDNFIIKSILQANFKEGVDFDLPEGAPPYTENENPAGISDTPLFNQIRRFRGLIVQNKGLPRFKKENTFINILESVHAEDAKILIAMKDKTLEKMYHGLTEACVRKAFPTLLNQRTS